MKKLLFVTVSLVLSGFCFLASGEATPISVSVLSNDGKFIGSSLGSAQIVIRDSLTGAILASGRTSGSTGDTARIMKSPQPRDHVLHSEGSARFEATLDLDRPTRVRVEATGPLAQMQSASTVTETWTLLPGKDYAKGNGLLLRMHGMVVDVLSPPAHLKTSDVEQIQVAANIMKMCGCPISAETPWPIERYTIEAHVYKAGGDLVETYPLPYAGEKSQFAGSIPMPGTGAFEIVVTAFDAKTRDSGADSTTVIILED